jgi:hypothetical protein
MRRSCKNWKTGATVESLFIYFFLKSFLLLERKWMLSKSLFLNHSNQLDRYWFLKTWKWNAFIFYVRNNTRIRTQFFLLWNRYFNIEDKSGSFFKFLFQRLFTILKWLIIFILHRMKDKISPKNFIKLT